MSTGPDTPLARFGALFTDAWALLRTHPRLRHSLIAWLVSGTVLTEAVSLGIATVHGGGHAWVALVAILWCAFLAVFMVGGATMLVDPAGEHSGRYGWPNGITLLRADACLPLLLCAYLSLPGHLALVLWCSLGATTAMLDYVDGLIARTRGPITQLGKALDPAMDALFFPLAGVGAMSPAVAIVPPWFAALVAFRYLGPLLATPVVLLSRRRPELVHTAWGRRNTAIIGAVFFVLMCVRIVGGPVGTVAVVVGLPTVVPTMLLHFGLLFERTRKAPADAV